MTTTNSTKTIGLILYILGALVAFTLLSLSVWGDVEANTFDAALTAEEPLNLNCPVLITQNETGLITATIKNPSDRDSNPNVRARITMGFVTLYDEVREPLPVPAQGSAQVQWEVTSANAAYHRLILARIYQFQSVGIPSRQEACGIVLLPFSGPTGMQIFYGGLIFSVLAIFLGLRLYFPVNKDQAERVTAAYVRRRRIYRALIFLGSYFVAATVASLFVDWLGNVLLMIFAFVSLIAVSAFAATPQ